MSKEVLDDPAVRLDDLARAGELPVERRSPPSDTVRVFGGDARIELRPEPRPAKGARAPTCRRLRSDGRAPLGALLDEAGAFDDGSDRAQLSGVDVVGEVR